MQDLLYTLHDAIGDRAIQNALLVALFLSLRRLPLVLVALASYLARVGKTVGVPHEETGRFIRQVRAATGPHTAVEPE